MKGLIDTHAHIYAEEFKADTTNMIETAQKAGVERIYMPNIDTDSIEPMLRLEASYPGYCFPMMGLHPCYVGTQPESSLAIVEGWLGKKCFCAIGEVGLDYHWDISNKAQQMQAFELQIQWAMDLNIPIIIHSRKSMDDCIMLIKKYQKGNLKGIFHCFSGSLEEARRIEGLGFLMGIGGVLTYKNTGLKETVKQISMAQLVLETDAPYLTPVPYRGKRNEPSYLGLVAEALSEAKEISVEEVGNITSQNALKLFGHSN